MSKIIELSEEVDANPELTDVGFDSKAAIKSALADAPKKEPPRRQMRIWIADAATVMCSIDGVTGALPCGIDKAEPHLFEIAQVLRCGVTAKGQLDYSGPVRDVFLARVEVTQKREWKLDSITMTEAQLSKPVE